MNGRLHFRRVIMTAALLGCASITEARAVIPSGPDAVLETVERFIAAQTSYDSEKLDEMATADFIEISPIGTVDARATFLSFYRPARKPAVVVQVSSSEQLVRKGRDVASVVMTLAYTIDGKLRPGRVRAGYVLQRQGDVWRLSTAQYTPLRTPAP